MGRHEIWADSFRRDDFQSGELKRCIDAAQISGIAISPRSIEHLVLSTTVYDKILTELFKKDGIDAETLCTELVVLDAREAADLLSPTNGLVSVRLNPRTLDVKGVIVREAEALWKKIGRPNLLIRIPATEAGIGAFTELRKKKIPVRIGDIFSPGTCRRIGDAPFVDLLIDPLEFLTDSLLEDHARSASSKESQERIRTYKGRVGAALAEELRKILQNAPARLILSSATPARIPDVSETIWELPLEYAEAEPIRVVEKDPEHFFEELRELGISIEKVADLVREQVRETLIREHDHLAEAIAKKRRELLSDRINLLSLSLPAEMRLIVDEHLDASTEIEAPRKIWEEMKTALGRPGAEEMVRFCEPGNPPRENPGIFLGVILGTLLKHGRRNLTVVRSERFSEFDPWLAKLWAPDVLQVAYEEFPTAPVYALDRIFAHIRTREEFDEDLEESLISLHRSGHCVIRIVLRDKDSLAQEFFRWEMATRAARHLLIPEDEHEISLKRRLSRL